MGGGVYTLNEHKGNMALVVCSRFVLSAFFGRNTQAIIDRMRQRMRMLCRLHIFSGDALSIPQQKKYATTYNIYIYL